MGWRVAIVEDDQKYAQILEEYIKRYAQEEDQTIQTYVYADGMEFLSDKKIQPDIVFMDIEMPFLNGIDVSKRMREKDALVQLIFVTNLEKYAVQGYAVDAMDYLLKPVNYRIFHQTFAKAIVRARMNSRREITLHTSKGLQRVAVDHIYYLDLLKHHVFFHTMDGVIDVWGSLSEYEQILPGRQFVRCNSCYLVNLKMVTKQEKNKVYIGDEVLEISRGKKKDFLNALTEFVGE